MSRQNFYRVKHRRSRAAVDEELIVNLVRRERQLQPMLGGRKLRVLTGKALQEAGVSIGRDRFFEVLRRHDLLIPRPTRRARTTQSRHSFQTYGNLLRDTVVTAPHQAWVCDLTYIRTDEGFLYLSHIMDAFSRKVVGYDIGDTLEASGCLNALQQAVKQLPEGSHPVHHSDRGTQYCCREYVGRLQARKLSISMTEENHCYENAMSERLNGIFKGEYGLGDCLQTKAHGIQATKQAVWLYDNRRPHTSLKYQTPAFVHSQTECEPGGKQTGGTN